MTYFLFMLTIAGGIFIADILNFGFRAIVIQYLQRQMRKTIKAKIASLKAEAGLPDDLSMFVSPTDGNFH